MGSPQLAELTVKGKRGAAGESRQATPQRHDVRLRAAFKDAPCSALLQNSFLKPFVPKEVFYLKVEIRKEVFSQLYLFDSLNYFQYEMYENS